MGKTSFRSKEDTDVVCYDEDDDDDDEDQQFFGSCQPFIVVFHQDYMLLLLHLFWVKKWKGAGGASVGECISCCISIK